MRILNQLLILALVLAGFVITSLNTEPILFNYYLGSTHLPLSVFMLCSFGIGCLFGLALNALCYIKLKRAHRQLQHSCQELELTINRLKPIGKPTDCSIHPDTLKKKEETNYVP